MAMPGAPEDEDQPEDLGELRVAVLAQAFREQYSKAQVVRELRSRGIKPMKGFCFEQLARQYF